MSRVARQIFGTEALRSVVDVAEGRDGAKREQLATALASFWGALWAARSPRYRAGSERIDARRTIRDMVRGGGELTHLVRRRRERPRRLIVLADCSESGSTRRGFATLLSALTRVDSSVVVLGFDVEVFRIRALTVSGAADLMRRRALAARSRAVRPLTIARLDHVLKSARQYSPSPTQASCLILSDLFLAEGESLESIDLTVVQRRLSAYAAVWLVDTWSEGPPFHESPDGWVTCSASDLLKLLREEEGGGNPSLSWREAESERRWYLDASALERIVRLGDRVALRARRYTPVLRELGFTGGARPSRDAPFVRVPMATPHTLAEIFRATRPGG